MEMAQVETLLNITISALTLFIVAWINIKIKFANNEKEAIRLLRSNLFRFAAIIVNSISFLFIAYFLLLPDTTNSLEIITLILIFISFAMQLTLKMNRNIFDALKK